MPGKERVLTLRFPSGPALRSAHLPGHPQDPGEALEKSLSPPGEGIPAGDEGLRYAGELGACWNGCNVTVEGGGRQSGSDSGKKMELGSLEHWEGLGWGVGAQAEKLEHGATLRQ